MSNAATETAPDEVTPFTEGDREIAYRSEAAQSVSLGPSGRPAVVAKIVKDGECARGQCPLVLKVKLKRKD